MEEKAPSDSAVKGGVDFGNGTIESIGEFE